MNQVYLNQLCREMNRHGLDAMLICPSEDLRFLCGFSPMLCERFQGLFLKADGTLFYVCNLLYRDELIHASGGKLTVFTWFDGEVMEEKVGDILQRQGLWGKTIGVNTSVRTWQTDLLSRRCGIRFTSGVSLIEESRIHKTPEEINALKKAAEIADEAYRRIVKIIRPGMTEREIHDHLCASMSELGGSEPGGLVASGSNSSYPHYMGLDRTIDEQDLMILDFGCTINGMHSDTSRTVFVGDASAEQRSVYELVLNALEAAEKKAVTGVPIPEVDRAARSLIQAAGYGETMTTRLGHGIGYMVHEAPDIKESNRRILEPGMAFSIEPGVYLAGRFGVRIEDIVITTDHGNEVLNQSSRELIVTG